ncbi:MAG TPA: RnfABCDGE type electron transport complex subunit D [Acidobacteriota bacterium]|nr:RnfABCDGE type electron transport complex subunit D [Acidobacteriota bacterium]
MVRTYEKLNVASSPHWRDGSALDLTYKLWLLALAPAMIVSLLMFGWQALRVLGLAVACSVFLDALVNRIKPSKDFTTNWSSVTFGVILALMMPYDAAWWLILVGCLIMIVVGKKLFGGVGAYPVHPVLLSLAMLHVSWPHRFDFTASMVSLDLGVKMVEPMRLVKTLGAGAEAAYRWQDLLLGKQVAGIGSGLVLYLLIGGLLLILFRQIPWHIPVAFIVGNLVMGEVLHLADPVQFATPLFYLLSGGTVFAAFFLATEYTTSPVNPVPMLLYGFLGGALLIVIRAFSNYTDGVVFTILLINLCNPLLDRITPRVYGIEAAQHA